MKRDYENDLALHQMRKMEKRRRERRIGTVIGVIMLFIATTAVSALDAFPVGATVALVLSGSFLVVMGYARGYIDPRGYEGDE